MNRALGYNAILEENSFEKNHLENRDQLEQRGGPVIAKGARMTVRIEITSHRSKTVVSVAGRLEGLGVGELVKTCQPIEGELVLDLSSLHSADAEGIEAIEKLSREGVTLRGASPFIRLLLESQQHGNAGS
jgi:hypothetical protein